MLPIIHKKTTKDYSYGTVRISNEKISLAFKKYDSFNDKVVEASDFDKIA